ncbi:MAG: hypothetical protein K2O78_03130 [Muribaculaceae bacterium]|nr:hypothetical protein [Muribaculaceae bacterium]MDE7080628.1 hypothetical protein [Muribaculaceae bacterium]
MGNDSNASTQSGKTATVADQLVDMRASAGVRHIYGITGDSLNAITAAINTDGPLSSNRRRANGWTPRVRLSSP